MERPNESLRNYLKHFTENRHQIDDCSTNMALLALMKGIQYKGLCKSVAKKKFDELLDKFDSYVTVDDS